MILPAHGRGIYPRPLGLQLRGVGVCNVWRGDMLLTFGYGVFPRLGITAYVHFGKDVRYASGQR